MRPQTAALRVVGCGGRLDGIGHRVQNGDPRQHLGPPRSPQPTPLLNVPHDTQSRHRSPRYRPVTVFLGDDLLPWLVLALGGALLVGNVAALVRPPEQPPEEGALERAPLTRSIVMAAVGLVAAVWAIASLVSS